MINNRGYDELFRYPDKSLCPEKSLFVIIPGKQEGFDNKRGWYQFVWEDGHEDLPFRIHLQDLTEDQIKLLNWYPCDGISDFHDVPTVGELLGKLQEYYDKCEGDPDNLGADDADLPPGEQIVGRLRVVLRRNK